MMMTINHYDDDDGNGDDDDDDKYDGIEPWQSEESLGGREEGVTNWKLSLTSNSFCRRLNSHRHRHHIITVIVIIVVITVIIKST